MSWTVKSLLSQTHSLLLPVSFESMTRICYFYKHTVVVDLTRMLRWQFGEDTRSHNGTRRRTSENEQGIADCDFVRCPMSVSTVLDVLCSHRCRPCPFIHICIATVTWHTKKTPAQDIVNAARVCSAHEPRHVVGVVFHRVRRNVRVPGLPVLYTYVGGSWNVKCLGCESWAGIFLRIYGNSISFNFLQYVLHRINILFNNL